MAKKPCKYQLPESDVWMSELEFKKALVDGLLDQMIMESGISIPALKGFSTDSKRAESSKLKRAKFGRMTEDSSLKSGQAEEGAISGDLLNEKGEALEEGKVSRSYEDIANKIRNIKIDTKGTAMSSLPGLVEAWNLAVEAAAKTVEVAGATADSLQKGIAAAEKAFKESDFYKSLKNRDERLRYMNDLRNGIQQTLEEKKPTGKQKQAGKQFKGKVEEATGVKPEQKMVTAKEVDLLKNQIRMESRAAKDSAKALTEAKEAVRKFVRESLPKEKYSVNEIKSIMSAISKAKDENSLNKAIDKVSDLVVKKNEQIRKKKISDIKKKIKDKKTLYTKVNGKWKGKITVDAQNEFNEFIGKLSELDVMSMDELTEVEDIINGIVENGKADFNRLKAIQEDRKMRDAADMLEELAGEPDAILSDNDAVETFLNEKEGGYVIIDGKMYNKSSYAKSPYSNKVNLEPISGPVKAYQKIILKEEQRLVEEKKTKLQKITATLKSGAVLLDNMYGYLQKIGKDASRTTEFINNNIVTPIKDYFIDSEVAVRKRMQSYTSGLKDIFGGIKEAKKRLNEDASVNPIRRSRKEGVSVSNSMLVSLYNMSRLEDGMNRLEKSGVDSQDLVDYIESNPDLLEYANFLVDQYHEMKAEYEPTYISVTNTPFPEGYYYPAYTDVNFDDDTFNLNEIIDEEGNFVALNAMVNNLKARTNYNGAFNTTLNAEEVFIDYVKNMERAKALIPVAKAANQLFSQQNRPYLLQKLTQEQLADLQKQLGIVFTGKRPPKDSGSRFLDKLMNYNVVTTLGFRLRSLPTQLVSFTNFWGQGIEDGINPLKVITAFPMNSTEWEFLSEIAGSEYLSERRKGKSLDLEVKRLLNTKNKNAFGRGWEKVASAAMYIPGGADYLANISPLGGGGSYAIAQLRNELSKGATLEEAKRTAFRNYVSAVEETQQTSREDYTSSFQRTGLGRMFSTYKTSQIGFARKIVKGFRTLGDSKATDKQKAQAYYDIVYYSLASSLLFNLVANGGARVLWGKEKDDEEFDEKQRVLYDMFMDQIQSVSQGFGIAGFIVDQTINSIREEDWKNNVSFIDFLKNSSESGANIVKRIVGNEFYEYDKNGELFKVKISDEDRARFIEEQGLNRYGLASDNYLEKMEQLYRDAWFWERMNNKERNQLMKTVGVKNIVKQAQDFYDAAQGDKSFMDAFMNYQEDYFESAKNRNKTDYIFKSIFGEDYIPNKKPKNKSPEYIGEEMGEYIPDNEIPEEEINN